MARFPHSPFDGQLEVVTSLGERVIEARVAELRSQDELTKALRSALRSGVDINDLSEASGLTVADIRRSVSRELHLGENLDALVGIS